MVLNDLNERNLNEVLSDLQAEMQKIKDMELKLDLSRGKPSAEQLNLCMEMTNTVNSKSILDSENGTDCRNYGVLDGIPEAKQLVADMIETRPENVIVSGNSSLTLMYDIIAHAMIHGLMGEKPWCFVENRKFLCPVPGYDRHFAITEHFGFELVTVPMKADGPDMDVIENLVASDDSIKGIWCVPKYQNPTGIVFSDDVVKRFAALKPAAKDFRIFWDNAYCVHPLYEDDEKILDIIDECDKAGNPDMVYEFCSTSKIAFPGSGIAAVASSPANIIDINGFMKYATIGPDKINQLRQVRFFKNLSGIKAIMAKHADILRPKFEAVDEILSEELKGTDFAKWIKPKGGYFISLDTLPGCADRVVALSGEMGVVFTPAGATYPYGMDKENTNIRIAPSFANIDEIKSATKILALAIKIASVEKLLGR